MSENQLAILLSFFNGSSPFDTAIVLSALPSGSSKIELLKRAGELALQDHYRDDYGEFTKIMNSLKGNLGFRNNLAHHLYAVNDKNQICIVNPKYALHDSRSVTVLSDALMAEKKQKFFSDFSDLSKFTQKVATSCPLGQPYAFRRRQHEASTGMDDGTDSCQSA